MKTTVSQLQADVKNLNGEISRHVKKFETERHKFISDGIVDVEKYFSASIKIMWILKESHDFNENGISGDWSMTDALAKGKLGLGSDNATWSNIFFVTRGILNSFNPYESLPKTNNSAEKIETLKSIAFVNVKKIPGGTKTTAKTLSTAYNDNREILLKQIETYQPDIVIGGSTLKLFKKDLKVAIDNELPNGHFYVGKRLFLDAKHPAQTSTTRLEYVNKIIQRAKEHKHIYSK